MEAAQQAPGHTPEEAQPGDTGPVAPEGDVQPAPPGPEVVTPPDQALDPASTSIPGPEPDDIENIIEPSAQVERVLVDSKGRSAKYVQTELTWFGRLEFYGLLGRVIDNAMSGENPLDLGDLLQATKPQSLIDQLREGLPGSEDAPDRDERESKQSLDQAGKILMVFARVISFAPDLMREVYCIILNVPKAHRQWAINYGFETMDPQMGEDVLSTFVDQNWEAVEDFFNRVLPRLLKRGRKARERYVEAR